MDISPCIKQNVHLFGLCICCIPTMSPNLHLLRHLPTSTSDIKTLIFRLSCQFFDICTLPFLTSVSLMNLACFVSTNISRHFEPRNGTVEICIQRICELFCLTTNALSLVLVPSSCSTIVWTRFCQSTAARGRYSLNLPLIVITCHELSNAVSTSVVMRNFRIVHA